LANFAGTDYYLLLNAVNMSPMAFKVSFKLTAVELKNTAFGATYESRIGGGLKDGSLAVDFNQDFAAAQVDALVFPLFGTVTTFELRPTSGARSATNPAYTGTLFIKEYIPIDGKVGDLAVNSVTWPIAGAVTRATS
jgi:hypothetical protein